VEFKNLFPARAVLWPFTMLFIDHWHLVYVNQLSVSSIADFIFMGFWILPFR